MYHKVGWFLHSKQVPVCQIDSILVKQERERAWKREKRGRKMIFELKFLKLWFAMNYLHVQPKIYLRKS